MNPQVQQALSTFSGLLQGRNSVLTEMDSKIALGKDGVVEKINYSVYSTFEERCARTGCRVATWIFDRNNAKFVLNRLYRKGFIKN